MDYMLELTRSTTKFKADLRRLRDEIHHPYGNPEVAAELVDALWEALK